MKQATEDDRAIGPRLWLLASLSLGCYALLLLLGPKYALEVDCKDRPLLGALALYAAASVFYLMALRTAVQKQSSWRLGAWIVGVAVVMRLLLLPTPPLQEIDIYRYLWDGAVVAQGEDPYALPPATVLNHIDAEDAASLEDRLARVASIARDRPGLEEALRTIHYAWLTSPYPPVSQAVFALTDMIAPGDWSAVARLRLLKGVLSLFDLATLVVLMAMLRRLNLPTGWAIAYGWCPLLLKEIAGSGHLDSIAIFFTTAALAAGLGAFDQSKSVFGRKSNGFGAAALLGLGVGAKLYPLVLAPLLLAKLWRAIGPRHAALSGVVFLLVAAASLAPMVWHERFWPEVTAELIPAEADPAVESLPGPPDTAKPLDKSDSPSGLRAFLNQWEMNDLLFMTVLENVRPQASVAEGQRPWFDMTSEAQNEAFLNQLRSAMESISPSLVEGRSNRQLAFLFTRTVTGVLFVVIALTLAWRSSRSEANEIDWLRSGFLTLAWFWLLAPTQNPWYWCWTLPLLPFARGRAWYVVSAACFLYYLRFYFECHAPDSGVWGTPYDGSHFYYYVVVWAEFFPILVWLFVEWAWRCWQTKNPT